MNLIRVTLYTQDTIIYTSTRLTLRVVLNVRMYGRSPDLILVIYICLIIWDFEAVYLGRVCDYMRGPGCVGNYFCKIPSQIAVIMP